MKQRLWGEAIGSFFLFATVVGSGIMAENMAGGNAAVALLGNTLATAAVLYVLITMLAPLSGAHFNPAVSLVMRLRGDGNRPVMVVVILVQVAAGMLGVFVAHCMFDLPVLQISGHVRAGPGQWLGEYVATFGLVLTILLTVKYRPASVPASVALYIAAAYWFTSSTSFANPAITIARAMTDTFSGIAPANVPGFILAQLAGAMSAHLFERHVLTGG